MKLRIGEQDYDFQRALQKIGISHLLDLKVHGGIGKRTVTEGLDALSDALIRKEGESDDDFRSRALEADENPVILRGLVGLVFICKRHAGEPVTFDEAGEYGLADLQFILEDSDIITPEVDADPTVASGDPIAPDAETNSERSSTSSGSAPKPSQKKSKTSRNTSISE